MQELNDKLEELTAGNKSNWEFKARRRQAIEWWNNINFNIQCDILKENNYSIRHPHTLTGREIETIWNNLNNSSV